MLCSDASFAPVIWLICVHSTQESKSKLAGLCTLLLSETAKRLDQKIPLRHLLLSCTASFNPLYDPRTGRPTTEIQEEQGKPRYTPPPTPVKPKQVLASPQFTHNSSQPGTPVYAPANYNCPPERAERGKRRSWGEEGSFTESERGTPLYAPGNSQQGQQRHLPSWRAAAVRAGKAGNWDRQKNGVTVSTSPFVNLLWVLLSEVTARSRRVSSCVMHQQIGAC